MLEDPISDNRTPREATECGNPVITIYTDLSLLKSGHLTSLRYYMQGAFYRQNNKHLVAYEKLKMRIMTVFTDINKETVQ